LPPFRCLFTSITDLRIGRLRVPWLGMADFMKRFAFLGGSAAIAIGASLLPTGALAAIKAKSSKVVKMSDGLQYTDLVVGTGASPQKGQKVTVNYVGTLTNGKKFDASADHGGTFSFNIGVGQVIRGWDEGVMSMKVGGKRRLVVPPELGYGAQGAGNVIPPNATLIFEVELVGIE
jgi:peptidylprolyl isomerase